MTSTVSHEMLTPLKCIVQIVKKLRDSSISVKETKVFLNTISDTCELVLG
jgi:hypothetical protein